MKAIFQIDFPSAKQAADAMKIIKAEKGRNTDLTVSHEKGSDKIIYTITASSFSPLRARSTSLLRDLKVMLSVFEKGEGR